MSGKVRKSSPCSTKSGPMRATLPMSSLMRQGSSLRKSKSNSPTLSPTSAWKLTDTSLSGQRSPGSLHYKAKSRTLNSDAGQVLMRRTASLDTIYLNGHWPRQSFYLYGGLLVDKATQTEDCCGERRPHSDEKLLRYRRVNHSSRERLGKSSDHAGTNTPSDGVRPTSEKKMRSSIEGLNQEIERLVLKSSSSQEHIGDEDKLSGAAPEGHRAPLADLLRSTRSVNTQTPGNKDLSPGPVSRGSTPELLGTSPHIDRFLAREPPDGCEKISSKFSEDSRRPMIDVSQLDYCPLKPCLTLTPSLGSAFSPLQQAARGDYHEERAATAAEDCTRPSYPQDL